MDSEAPRPTRYSQASQEALDMLKLGESGRFEFKRDASAVQVKTLAALANWIAADPQRQVAHLLVGIDEVEDTATGLVQGVRTTLPTGLDRSVSRLQDLASKVRPIPVDLHIIEEGVDEEQPFLRVEIRPTMPPHFDDEGRRQTRQGRSTRALSDDELLRIYLDREAGTFATRFRHVSRELRNAVGGVSTQVDEISSAIERRIAEPLEELGEIAAGAASSASSAEAAATNLNYDVSRVNRLVGELSEAVDELQDDSPAAVAAQVIRLRRQIWWEFSNDTWHRTTRKAERLTRTLHTLLTREISLKTHDNAWEARVLETMLEERKQLETSAPLKWWKSKAREFSEFLESPNYSAPDLPDLRVDMQVRGGAVLEDPDSATNQFRTLIEDS